MEFLIKQNATLPLLKLQVVKDGRSDYNNFMKLIEVSSIFFSMTDLDTGIPKIMSRPAGFVEKTFDDPNAETEYYLYYQFTSTDTNLIGRFEGQFMLRSSDGVLILPIREKLFINVQESFVANDLEYESCYVSEFPCCIESPIEPICPPCPSTPTPTITPSVTPNYCKTFQSVQNDIIIFDNKPASVYPITFVVNGIINAIDSITLSLNGYSHSYVGDVGMLLVSPDGRYSIITGRDGAISSINGNVDLTTLSSNVWNGHSLGQFINNPYAYENLIFEPPCPVQFRQGEKTETLEIFLNDITGSFANGKWSLYIQDFATDDSGSLKSASITICDSGLPKTPTPTPTPTRTPTLTPGFAIKGTLFGLIESGSIKVRYYFVLEYAFFDDITIQFTQVIGSKFGDLIIKSELDLKKNETSVFNEITIDLDYSEITKNSYFTDLVISPKIYEDKFLIDYKITYTDPTPTPTPTPEPTPVCMNIISTESENNITDEYGNYLILQQTCIYINLNAYYYEIVGGIAFSYTLTSNVTMSESLTVDFFNYLGLVFDEESLVIDESLTLTAGTNYTQISFINNTYPYNTLIGSSEFNINGGYPYNPYVNENFVYIIQTFYEFLPPIIPPTSTPLPSFATPTPTSSQTPTQTPSMTQTVTPTVTQTVTNTPTNTLTETPTNTPTFTPTKTQTPSTTVTKTQTSSNTPTPSITPTNPICISDCDIVWLNQTNNLYRYTFSSDTNLLLTTITGSTNTSFARTSSKMWFSVYATSTIYEYDYTQCPFVLTFSRTITTPWSLGTGLFAYDNDNLIVSRQSSVPESVYELNILTNTNTFKFTLPETRRATEFVLSSNDKLFVLGYNTGGGAERKFSQYDYNTSTLEIETTISPTILYPYGMFQDGADLFLVNGLGSINFYSIDLNPPYTLSLSGTVGPPNFSMYSFGIVSGCVSNNLILPTPTPTVTPTNTPTPTQTPTNTPTLTNTPTPTQTPAPIPSFISVWTASSPIELPYSPTGTYSGTIDWGDGNISANTYANRTHNYALSGDYTVTITGVIEGWNFDSYASSYANSLKEILQWGPLRGEGNSNEYMFYNCQNLVLADVTDVPNLVGITSTSNMFYGCISLTTINNINNWDTSSVVNMFSMFNSALYFDSYIGAWNMSSVESSQYMFNGCQLFNEYIGGWDMSNVLYIDSMFEGATNFNQNISSWDTSNVIQMDNVFQNAISFNQDISGWNVSAATNMYNVFKNATSFNQNLGGWDVSNVLFMGGMLDDCGIDQNNYDNILIGWCALTLTNGVQLGVSGMTYSDDPCPAYSARTYMISNLAWGFFGDSAGTCIPPTPTNTPTPTVTPTNTPTPTVTPTITNTQSLTPTNTPTNTSTPSSTPLPSFISVWRTTTPNESITLPYSVVGTYIGTIDWGDSTTSTNSFANRTHTYTSSGNYIVKIYGDIIGFSFQTTPTSRLKIREITQWGQLKGLNSTNNAMFQGCTNLVLTGVTDTPILQGVTGVSSMFAQCSSITTINNLNSWDVSSVKIFSGMFQFCTLLDDDFSGWDVSNGINFNQMFFSCVNLLSPNVSTWNVSAATDLSFMFNSATAFTDPLNNWDVSNVTNFSSMFSNSSFNQELSGWTTSAATDISAMFSNLFSFNKNLSTWDVSNVVNMNYLFYNSNFNNSSISGWDTSSVTDMSFMFFDSIYFNQNLSSWDVSNVKNMEGIFMGATAFTQDISSWDVSNVTGMTNMLSGTSISKSTYDNILVSWSGLTLQSGVTIGVEGLQYSPSPCDGGIARTNIINNYGWTFVGDSPGSCP